MQADPEAQRVLNYTFEKFRRHGDFGRRAKHLPTLALNAPRWAKKAHAGAHFAGNSTIELVVQAADFKSAFGSTQLSNLNNVAFKSLASVRKADKGYVISVKFRLLNLMGSVAVPQHNLTMSFFGDVFELQRDFHQDWLHLRGLASELCPKSLQSWSRGCARGEAWEALDKLRQRFRELPGAMATRAKRAAHFKFVFPKYNYAWDEDIGDVTGLRLLIIVYVFVSNEMLKALIHGAEAEAKIYQRAEVRPFIYKLTRNNCTTDAWSSIEHAAPNLQAQLFSMVRVENLISLARNEMRHLKGDRTSVANRRTNLGHGSRNDGSSAGMGQRSTQGK